MPVELAYTQSVEDELQDLHRGLHQAMEHLIRNNEYDEAERILRIVDQRMSQLINTAQVVRLR